MNALFYLHPELLAKAMYEDELKTFHREYLCEFTKPVNFEVGERLFWINRTSGEQRVCEIKELPDRRDGSVLCKLFFRNTGNSYLRRLNVDDLIKP